MTVEQARAGVDEALEWRDRLALRLHKAMVFNYVGAAVVLAISVRSNQGRHELVAISVIGALTTMFTALTGRPEGMARGLMLVVPGCITSIVGYAVVGVLSGPGVCLTVTLMLAGLLCGRRVMILLTIASALAVGLVAWGIVEGHIPAPNQRDVTMTNPAPWIRSLIITFAAIGVFGTLMLAVIDRIERSLAFARLETQRREQAERQRAEAEIVALESRQLELVGRLAAGVAHDFNNNLTAIMSSAELIQLEAGKVGEVGELAGGILQASQRAAELTRQLLAYSRKAQMLLAPVDLHRIVNETVTLLRRSVDPKVRVLTELAPEAPVVAADTALFESALLNLLVNACDAMPDGGTLTISTKIVRTATGNAVALEVKDEGRGIDAALLPNIFDPFFTTKPIGRGTGLGLAAVAGTVKSHGGTIDVKSALGEGTRFTVTLPLKHETPASRVLAGEITPGSGEILLVDDDAMVSFTATTTLKSFGYTVTHAPEGKVAVELVSREPQRYALVLLDLRMPGMSGEQTFDALRAVNPELRVLIWSGYGAEQDIAAMLRRGAKGFIQKPYRVAELSRAIAEAMTR